MTVSAAVQDTHGPSAHRCDNQFDVSVLGSVDDRPRITVLCTCHQRSADTSPLRIFFFFNLVTMRFQLHMCSAGEVSINPSSDKYQLSRCVTERYKARQTFPQTAFGVSAAGTFFSLLMSSILMDTELRIPFRKESFDATRDV
jgi:hypothetical protein